MDICMLIPVAILILALYKMLDLSKETNLLNERLKAQKALIDKLREESRAAQRVAIRHRSTLITISEMLGRTMAIVDADKIEEVPGVSMFMSTIEDCMQMADEAVENESGAAIEESLSTVGTGGVLVSAGNCQERFAR